MSKSREEYYQNDGRPPSGDQFASLATQVSRIDEAQEEQSRTLVRLTTLQEESSRERNAFWEEMKLMRGRLESMFTVVGRVEAHTRNLDSVMTNVPFKVAMHEDRLDKLEPHVARAHERMDALEKEAASAAYRKRMILGVFSFLKTHWVMITTIIGGIGAVCAYLYEIFL